MGELETHYKRLCRVGEENLWKRGFGLLAVVLLGVVVGAALAGPGWTWEVKAAAALTVLAGLGWKGMAETESEGIKAIRDDYKEDILDSLVLEPVGGDTSDSDNSKSFDQLNKALDAILAGYEEPSRDEPEKDSRGTT